jgi:hypothetical protein
MVTYGARLMKYTLIAEDEFGGSKTTREFNVDYLPDVLSEVELFLKGAGFVFDGNLDFVNDLDEPPEWHTEEWDTPQEMYDTMDLPNNNWPFAAPHPKAPDEWTQTLRADAMAEGHSQYYYETGRNR